MPGWLSKTWCISREKHHFENDGQPVEVWGPMANPDTRAYRQVRRCPNCGQCYDTYAGPSNVVPIDKRERVPARLAIGDLVEAIMARGSKLSSGGNG